MKGTIRDLVGHHPPISLTKTSSQLVCDPNWHSYQHEQQQVLRRVPENHRTS
jgi:hypothetical protein